MSRERATLTVEELSIATQYADRSRAESLTAADFEVAVEFDYAKGEPARGMGGPWEDSSPEELAQCDIRSIKLARATEFCTEGVTTWYAKGYEMIGYFTAHQVEAMEEKLIARGQQKD